MGTTKEFTVRFATRTVTFTTAKFKDRGQLASAIRRREVISCNQVVGAHLKRQTWLNLGLVEQIL